MELDLANNNQRDAFGAYFRLDTESVFSDLIDYIESTDSSFEIIRDIAEDKELGVSTSSGEDIFSRSLRFSYIVLLHLMIEDRLKRTCDLILKMKPSPLDLLDLKRNNVEQCMIFLTKAAEIQKIKLSHWQDITDLSKIRDCIVHMSGRLEPSRDKDYLGKLINQKPSYFSLYKDEIFPDEELRVSLKYCIHATSAANQFFQSLFDMIGIKRIEDLIASARGKE
jgi:hypothetical protein